MADAGTARNDTQKPPVSVHDWEMLSASASTIFGTPERFPPPNHSADLADPSFYNDPFVPEGPREINSVFGSNLYGYASDFFSQPEVKRDKNIGLPACGLNSRDVEKFGLDSKIQGIYERQESVVNGIKKKVSAKEWLKKYNSGDQSAKIWSVALAAAVVGIVLIGQRWQQQRIHELKVLLQVQDQRISQLLVHISQLKETVASGGHRSSGSLFEALREYFQNIS